MATRAQRQRKRKEKKEQQRRKKQAEQAKRARGRESQWRNAANTLKSLSRHQQRMAQQNPRAFEGELPEDVAVFDDAALESLSPEHAEHVTAVRKALEHACGLRADEARKCVADVPRSSPLSEWRLFIRGLSSWLADDTSAAGEAFSRLDFQRRPGRVAVSLMTSLRTDLEGFTVENAHSATGDDEPARWSTRLDERLLYHGKLLRRVRFERPAVRIAEAGTRVPEEDRDLKLGPRKIDWLKQFVREYRDTEPHLVGELEQTALARAYHQSYSDLFEQAAAALSGPRHDRRNLLLRFFYYYQFRDGDRKADGYLQKYLKDYLPNNEELPQPLRSAIASQIHFNEAMELLNPGKASPFDFWSAPAENSSAIRQELEAAVKCYPANRGVYQEHADWLTGKLNDERLKKSNRKPLEVQLAKVMTNWAKALPDDVRPRLWLVDYLLENEQTKEAEPHVKWLAGARHDDPRVKAAPWKWQLLEAMRLCRRKSWLDGVEQRLEEADRIWPAWLSNHWLPYLQAAYLLRSGNTQGYEEHRQDIVNLSGIARNSVADACMMLGAAQLMRVPATELKPLRAPVDAAVKRAKSMALDDLLVAGQFFWDLHRTQLVYPAYRMHGGKLAKELWRRFGDKPKLLVERAEDERIHAGLLWCSAHRFFSDGYEIKPPLGYRNPKVAKHPMFAAARLNAFLKLQRHWRCEEHAAVAETVREAASTQRDAYYRYWFAALAEEFDQVRDRQNPRGFGSFADIFGTMGFGSDDDNREDFDDDDSEHDGLADEIFEALGFDPDCDCESCQAAKRAYDAAGHSRPR